jgi:hypothetical protein
MRLCIELGLDGIAGPAGPDAPRVRVLGDRVPALYHKARDHAVKGRVIIESLFCKVDEILDMARCHVGEELQGDVSEFRFKDRFRGGHFFYLLWGEFFCCLLSVRRGTGEKRGSGKQDQYPFHE